jgi:hypothetical protein
MGTPSYIAPEIGSCPPDMEGRANGEKVVGFACRCVHSDYGPRWPEFRQDEQMLLDGKGVKYPAHKYQKPASGDGNAAGHLHRRRNPGKGGNMVYGGDPIDFVQHWSSRHQVRY